MRTITVGLLLMASLAGGCSNSGPTPPTDRPMEPNRIPGQRNAPPPSNPRAG
jgi:hypothetical protein